VFRIARVGGAAGPLHAARARGRGNAADAVLLDVLWGG
jgi:hypothetical protein